MQRETCGRTITAGRRCRDFIRRLNWIFIRVGETRRRADRNFQSAETGIHYGTSDAPSSRSRRRETCANVPARCTALSTCRMIFEYVPLGRLIHRETKKMVRASAELQRAYVWMAREGEAGGEEGIETVKLGKHRSVAEVYRRPFAKMSPRTMGGKRLCSGYLVAQTLRQSGLYHISVLAAAVL